MSITSHLSTSLWYAAAPALAMIVAGCGTAALSRPTALRSNDPSSSTLPSHDTTPTSTLQNDGHTGHPVTHADGRADPRGPLTSEAAARQVMTGLSGQPHLVGIRTTSTPSGLDVTVTLSRNDDRVPDVWLADLAVGALAELVHSDQAVANDLIASATATGPGKGGHPVTTNLGVGAVRLGQLFGSPTDSTLAARVTQVAERHGLEVSSLQILYPLESALSVTFVVPTGATIDWTIEELRSALVGQSPDVEGVLIELHDADGQPLLQSGVAYRTGGGGLWFAPGQDERFGAVHGGMPGTQSEKPGA